MKIKLLIAVLLLGVTAQLYGQDRGVYRAGYLRLGVNTIGDPLMQDLSPKENIFDGRYGASRGYTFEFGHIFYFGGKNSQSVMNLGLDWTILSLNYNKLEKWKAYGENSGARNVEIGGEKIAFAGRTKLGPVLSMNLGGSVLLDVRFQIAPTIRYFDFNYSENAGEVNERYFSYVNNDEEDNDVDYDPEAIKNRLAFGVAKSYGATLRRKALGLSVDYVVGQVKSPYEARNSGFNTSGKEKIQSNSLHFTVNFTF
ncbi:hypothetical protein [Pedobacter sp.]|uniref:hypothetical protein n=1 Tax=Pedobacter sp. TaxID=1411316 RepID=UPI003D7FF900